MPKTVASALNVPEQPGVEVRAAGAILEQVLGTLDRADLEERLRRVEELPEVQVGQSRT